MKRHKNIKIFTKTLSLLILSVFIFVNPSSADEISFQASVDKNVTRIGSGVELSLSFRGIQNISAPKLPDIKDFRWKYVGPSTLMSITNGKVTNSVTHMYLLIPEKTGKLEIPSLSVVYNGKTYSSKPIPIEVLSSSANLPASRRANAPAGRSGGEELGDRLFLTIEPAKNTAYVNEKIPVSIKLYINSLTVRNITYPVIEDEAFLIDNFSQPRQYNEVFNGISYNVIDFSTSMYGLYPGEFRIKPAKVNCNIAVRRRPSGRQGSSPFDESFFGSNIFDSFFGQYQNYPVTIESIGIPINILPLPQEGKPASFNGALGNFNFSLQVSPKEVKVGDPIVLTMKVSGTGNFNTVNAPEFNFPDLFKTYEPEIKLGRKSKTFEQVVIPKNDKVRQVPPVSFSYFNTNTKAYKTITTAPVPINVLPLKKGEELKVFEMPSGSSAGSLKRTETLGRDIVYIKDNPGSICRKNSLICRNKFLIVLLFLPMIAVVLSIITHARKEYLEADVRYARRLKAPRKAKKNLAAVRRLSTSQDTDKFYEAVFKTLQEYIGDKFHLPSAGITSDVIDELKARNVDTRILDELKNCFDACDRSRYAPVDIQRGELRSVLKLVEDIIDKMEKIRT